MHRGAHKLASGSWRSVCPTKYLRLRRVRKRGRGRTKISGRFGYSETVTFTVRVGHNGRQGAGRDNRLCKGATASKVLVETTGCGRAQRPARFWRKQLVVEGHNGRQGFDGKKSYTATVGKGPAEEVLYGNGQQGFDGKKSYTATVDKGPTEEVQYINSRQGSDRRSPIWQRSARV